MKREYPFPLSTIRNPSAVCVTQLTSDSMEHLLYAAQMSRIEISLRLRRISKEEKRVFYVDGCYQPNGFLSRITLTYCIVWYCIFVYFLRHSWQNAAIYSIRIQRYKKDNETFGLFQFASVSGLQNIHSGGLLSL